ARLGSDWSSDVCSSDLFRTTVARPAGIKASRKTRKPGTVHSNTIYKGKLLFFASRFPWPTDRQGRQISPSLLLQLIDKFFASERSEERRVGKRGESRCG